MSDLIGKSIGQYQIVEQIGMGGMATVYKAYQPSMDRYVAIKILPGQLAQDPNFSKRFEQEARAIAALEHPHILPIHDFGTADGHTYMVMRYVEGGTLSDQMGKPATYERIGQLIINIARALDYAHQQGVVHRDIKPSNILIDNHGEALLTDFGVAKMVAGTESTQLTAAGSILGTPAYMSPEQASSTEVDGRSDIYSLGVVLYELLAGQPPYQAETPLAVVLKHVNDPLPPPRTIKPQIPEPLERVVLKALAKKANQRFQTAGEMVQALQQALKEIDGSSTAAEMPALSRPTAELTGSIPSQATSSRNTIMGPLLIGGGILALVLCVAGGGIMAWALMASGEPDIRETTPTVSGRIQATLPAAQTVTSSPTPVEPTSPASPPPVASETNSQIDPDYLDLGGEVIFEEDFTSNRRGWHTGEEEDQYGFSNASFVDGRYRLSHEAKQDVVWWVTLDDQEFDDFVLLIEATPVEYNAPFAYGVVFRRTFEEDFYLFQVDSDGYFAIYLFEDGGWNTLVDYTELAAINREGSNQLAIEAIGPMMTFFINGEEATSIEDDTLTAGSIGVSLELYQAENTATVDFDNLTVLAIDSEEMAPLEESILFEETFDSDANGWATGEFENDYAFNEITIENGVYTLHVEAKQKAYVEKTLPNGDFSDFVLTLDATPLDTEEHYSYGVAFRENEELHTYAFEIGNDRLYSVQLYDGEWKTLKDWSSTSAINVGETNELKVIADGSSLAFFVNGQELTTIEDNTLSSGTVGLVVDMFEQETEAVVEFDNLLIRELGEEESP